MKQVILASQLGLELGNNLLVDCIIRVKFYFGIDCGKMRAIV
jgi:hypothetical protein